MSKVIFYKPFSFIGLDIPLVVLWLVLGAIFFTIFMKFVNVKGFFHAIQLVRGKYDDPDDKGEVSHFQALVTALSGTVGLGNIAGVAVAITLGGAGATFWMILAGLLGMSSKFVECTLGVKYRNIDEDGEVSSSFKLFNFQMKIFAIVLPFISTGIVSSLLKLSNLFNNLLSGLWK